MLPRSTAQPGQGSTTTRGVDFQSVTVKGARARAEQLSVINRALTKARELGASERVMVACVMTMTNESTCLELGHGDAVGPDSRGPYQQRNGWGPLEQRMDAAGSTELFLMANKGPGVEGWVAKHGGIKVAPADLGQAIFEVQIGGSPSAFNEWEPEATKTVRAWLGGDGLPDASGGGGRYEFTRGERNGEREDSWEASGRLAEEVAVNRWAAANVFHYVSDDELRQQKPSVRITGDEAWLLKMPSWSWSGRRPIAEVSLTVAADRWGVMPGGLAVLEMEGPFDGRWIVAGVSGSRLDSPEIEVTLRRPTAPRPEPAAETTTEGGEALLAEGGDATGLVAACKEIHDAGVPYVYGGGHGTLQSDFPRSGLDCSSSSSYALMKAGYGFKPGDGTKVSGAFAASWGEPGEGRTFTVWANGEHVWIEIKGDPQWKRFDTSPHGDGGSGPRLRTTARSDTGRFTARRWPGQ